MIKQFMEMVSIDSESGEEAAFIEYLMDEFKKIGINSEKDSYGNLIGFLPAKGCSDKEPILLSCHADTVKPGKGIIPILEDGVIRSQGDTILGADDKAGIAEMLEALRIAPIHPPVEIAISRQEEVGLLGVKNMDYSRITAKKGFLLDNDELNTIVIGGPSYYAIDVEIKGKAAHAGMEPEKGINAIWAAAKAIAALKMGRIDNETTANVGVIKGGLIRNGVPEHASFMAECRSLNHAKAEQVATGMEKTIRDQVASVGASINITVNNLCQAVNIPVNSWTVNIAKKAFRTVGVDPKTTLITGFTDASIYNNKGIEMAVIGIGAHLEHSCEEYINIADMEKAVAALVEILRLSAE